LKPEWLLLTYKVPSEPSSKRVSIWRKLKSFGAVYIQKGVCIVPITEEQRRHFKIIQKEIINMKGEAFLLETTGFDEKEEEHIIARINEDRNAEYQEFLGRCEDFFEEIRSETEKQNFIYAEVQENDEDLQKLKRWLDKIKKRDFYGAPLLQEAEKQLVACEKLLDDFAEKVFKAENDVDNEE
jgi:hypothetical protein